MINYENTECCEMCGKTGVKLKILRYTITQPDTLIETIEEYLICNSCAERGAEYYTFRELKFKRMKVL